MLAARRDPVAAAAKWSVVVPCVPIVVMVVRAVVTRWQPLGDAPYFAVRSRDVLAEHHPLLGAWSSGSLRLDASVNNLGPLQFDLLAPFTHLWGPEGLAVGIGVVNLACVVGVWAVARNMVGPLGVLTSVAMTVLLQLSIGSRAFVEARQQWALLLPLWCLCFLVWAVASGRSWALTPAVLVASFIAQTHLTDALVAAPLCLVAVAGFALNRTVLAAVGAGDHPDADGAAIRRPALIAGAVAIACWAQPLWDQFFDSGNLGRVLRSGEAQGIGARNGARVLTEVLATPPFWLGRSLETFDPGRQLPSTSRGWVGLAALLAVSLAAAGVALRRPAARSLQTAACLAPVFVLSSWWATTRIPSTSLGLARLNYLWLWPLGAFATFGVLAGVWTAVGARARPHRIAAIAAACATSVIAAVPIVATVHRDAHLRDQDRLVRAARELRAEMADGLGRVELRTPVVFDRSAETVFSPFGFLIMAQLQDSGVEFVVDNELDGERFSDRRVEAAAASRLPRLFVVTGSNRDRIVDGTLDGTAVMRLADASGVSAADDTRRSELDEAVVESLRDGGTLDVDIEGARKALGGRVDPLVATIAGDRPRELLSTARALLALRDRDLVTGDRELLASLDEWVELHSAYELDRVAVYIEVS